MTRILIAGGPQVGKTWLAAKLPDQHGIPLDRVRHTDSLIGSYTWSDLSAEVARWLDEPGPWLIEGVAVVRALRKWLAAHPSGKPADLLFFGSTPKLDLTPPQRVMTKGHQTIWSEIQTQLLFRGLEATPF